MSKKTDILIIGGGPAGLTAAVYALRSGKKVTVVEKATFGGQITWSPKVENFPGVISATGNEIGDMLLTQAMEQGADVELEQICSVEKVEEKNFICKSESGEVYESSAVIIATGAKPRMLGIAKEEDLVGNGVCYCAVCDGAFFSGQDVAVNGGGNSALQDALLLSEKCRKVYLIHRRDSFRGEQKLVDALKNKPNVEFVMNSSISELAGESELEGIILDSGRKLDVTGLFVAIGHKPDNEIFKNLIALTENGYADSNEDCVSITPGVFVAGDCRVKKVHQLTTACADGAVAALAAVDYIG